jgi:phage terminase small subunit
MTRGRKPADPKVRTVGRKDSRRLMALPRPAAASNRGRSAKATAGGVEGRIGAMTNGDPGSKGEAGAKGAEAQRLYPPPPDYVTDPNARGLWQRVIPDLIRRKKYLSLFEVELARYCVAFGLYVEAARALKKRGGKGVLAPVVTSQKNNDMLSQHWVVMNNAHKVMQTLAGDLGMNPVAYQRIENLQLDLFPDADNAGESPARPSSVTPFGEFRRGA